MHNGAGQFAVLAAHPTKVNGTLWAAGGKDSTIGASSFQILPLNEVGDEHYSVCMRVMLDGGSGSRD